MNEHEQKLDLIDKILGEAVDRGLLHSNAEDERLDGRRVRVSGRQRLHFASCSYLGLELDPRLKEAAIQATMRYGTQFSSSRAYLSAPPYRLLEELLAEIFCSHVIAAPSTSMAHHSVLPVLVQSGDLVVLDHQVHQSVQTACQPLAMQGAKIELLRHGRLDLLEEILSDASGQYARVWYAVDGIYSMFGDQAPMAELHQLLDRYEHFRLYVDDAHGMSWKGARGCGHALSEHAIHPHMVMVTSLNKSFAAAGGAIVLPDAKSLRRVRLCAGPLTFSGPIQPPMLGAAVASAQLHLSDEIESLQQRLAGKIALCNRLMAERGLPLASAQDSPIRFLAVGLPSVGMNLATRLLREGFFLNAAGFPAVPIRRCGLRFTLTLHQREDDLRALIDAIERNFAAAFEEEGQNPELVWKQFGLDKPDLQSDEAAVRPPALTAGATNSLPSSTLPEIELEIDESIEKIPKAEWDGCLGRQGALSWNGLRLLERCFAERRRPEEQWKFTYFRFLDRSGKCLLSTFFTQALWKDDMLSPAATSRELETRRVSDPYLMTTPVLSMGSLLTEGEHLYVDPNVSDGQRADLMACLIEAVERQAQAQGARMIVLRDFVDNDPARDEAMLRAGFIKQSAPESFVLELNWRNEEEFLSRLSSKSRYHHRKRVTPFNDTYDMEILGADTRMPTTEEFDRMVTLYENVKQRALDLNTFALPGDFWQRVAEAPDWEILAFRPSDDPTGSRIAGMLACMKAPGRYIPAVVGLDYHYVEQGGLYRQTLRHVIARAQSLGSTRVYLGMGARLEKMRFGARAIPQCAYLQADDHYGAEAIAQLTVQMKD